MANIFEILGIILTVLFFILVLVLAITMLLILYSVKTKKVLFPKFILFVLDFLYNPLKLVTEKIGVNKGYIDMVSNDMRNFINYKSLSKIPFEDRIVLLPQCLRKRDCPARLDSIKGFQCTKCGRCGVGDIMKFCDEKNIKVFIVPGGSFVKKVIKLSRPKAIIGVGCHIELREASLVLEYLKVPGRGINLEKDGCIETKVNYEKVKKAIIISDD